MRRILLSCALLALFLLPAAAGASASTKPGFLVVRKAGVGGVNGPPVATVIVKGFVLGRVSNEGQVDIFQLPSANGQGAPQVKGADVATTQIKWHPRPNTTLKGTRFRASNFRFRAMGGSYRVVVRGSGIYLFAGGKGLVMLRGSSVYPTHDGTYSVNGRPFRSLPARLLQRTFGGG
jgi:hypothetical protein